MEDLTRRGHSEAVERIQALLLAHGYGPEGLVDPQTGQPDGLPGPSTRKQLERFKRALGLPAPYTTVDADTWWVLLAAGIDAGA
jgi:peptidoglycan hydrolase-like protein with peptidoglycan-binding domain